MKSSLLLITICSAIIAMAGAEVARSNSRSMPHKPYPAGRAIRGGMISSEDPTTPPDTTLEWPLPLSPVCDGSYYNMWTQIFRWSAIPRATRYRFQIGNDPTFAYFSKPALLDTTMADTSFTLKLDYSIYSYYWRVIAYNDLETSGWADCAFRITFGTGVEETMPKSEGLRVDLDPATRRGTVRFELAAPRHVSLAIYDLRGTLVGTIADGDLDGGYRSVPLNLASLPSGRYLISTGASSVPFILAK